MNPVHASSLSANGLNFHALQAGEGPTVLLLHGFPENAFAWRHQIEALAALGYRAVAIDMRGYRGTSRPKGVAAYASDPLCRDIDGVIEALGNRPAHLVGHDWGGAVAWEFAARFPRRLRSLSILNAPHPDLFERHLRSNLRQLRRSWYMFFFQIPWLPEALLALNLRGVMTKMFRGMAVRKEMFGDDVIEAFATPMAEPGALTAGLNYYRAAARGLLTRRWPLPAVTVPTQVIWADGDEALGPELCDDLRQYVTGPLEVTHIPECSHWVQQEQPERVNALLADFLGRTKAVGS